MVCTYKIQEVILTHKPQYHSSSTLETILANTLLFALTWLSKICRAFHHPTLDPSPRIVFINLTINILDNTINLL